MKSDSQALRNGGADMRKKAITAAAIFAAVLSMTALCSIFAMRRSDRIPSSLRSSEEAWMSVSEDTAAYIYNKDNVTENYQPVYNGICRCISAEMYNGKYPSNEIADSERELLLVLKHGDATEYFMLDFNASGNFFSHDGALIKYNADENSLDMNNAADIGSGMLFGSSVRLKFDSEGKIDGLNGRSLVFKKDN